MGHRTPNIRTWSLFLTLGAKQLVKRRLLQKSKGNFLNKVPGEFCGGFFGGFFQDFFLGKKQEEKIHPKIHGNFEIRIWEFRGQNPHCKDPALTTWSIGYKTEARSLF